MSSLSLLTTAVSLAYLVGLIGVVVYLLVLATRFVRAHERGADALGAMARKLRADPDAKDKFKIEDFRVQ
ncbi:hypothetical protein H0E84_05785 [Luteimonas sp. SJ-92]|uniref:Uncharacterized protein n=1 Tax=Luteimonas salinisoli TaxID=2752307 RepID=A0A853JB85_9GAMM|nr:hypothetical protein [Luteimonas salinisoli]NZA25888.1 hypothetical protein [Luteimonas salinisoli]